MQKDVTLDIAGVPVTLPASAIAQMLIDKLRSQSTPASPALQRTTPMVGKVWPGEGGTYCTKLFSNERNQEYHLILAGNKAADKMNWDSSIEWANNLTIDGHNDFTLPTPAEQAVLFGVMQDQFEKEFYWSSQPYAGNPGYAWGRYFGYGDADSFRKSNEDRVAAVRRIFI